MISCWLQPALQADLEAEYQQKLALWRESAAEKSDEVHQARSPSSDPALQSLARLFAELFDSALHAVDTNRDPDSSDEFRRTRTIPLLHWGFGEGMLQNCNITSTVT
jgi:hypothetical protein